MGTCRLIAEGLPRGGRAEGEAVAFKPQSVPCQKMGRVEVETLISLK